MGTERAEDKAHVSERGEFSSPAFRNVVPQEGIAIARRAVGQHLDELPRRMVEKRTVRSLKNPDWLDPVRTKNLEKITDRLQDIAAMLARDASLGASERLVTLHNTLDRLEDVSRLSSHGAWDVADELEAEILRMADEPALFAMLVCLHISGEAPEVADLLTFNVDPIRPMAISNIERARAYLFARHQDKVDGYRRDRALMELRGRYLYRTVIMLSVLLVTFVAVFFWLNRNWTELTYLATTLLAGAIGSLMSRGFKMRQEAECEDLPSRWRKRSGLSAAGSAI